jgi:two-component system, chemotaxis family, sensor kinase CheA
VSTEDNRVRLPPDQFHEFWSNMVHAIRNAVDHGIETTEERLAAGKSPQGHLRLTTRVDDRGLFTVEIDDDGRGIDFEQIGAVARQRGLPANTTAELIEAMLVDGISSRAEVTEISGRGIGTSALKRACENLGGSLRVESRAGRGTRFVFEFPPGTRLSAAA